MHPRLEEWRHLPNVFTTKVVMLISQIDVASVDFTGSSISIPKLVQKQIPE